MNVQFFLKKLQINKYFVLKNNSIKIYVMKYSN